MTSRVWKCFLSSALLLAVACGGGGGGEAAPPAEETSTPTESPSDSSEQTRVGTLTITPSTCTMDVSGPVRSGSITFDAQNRTDTLAAFNIAQLDPLEEGFTFEDFSRHVARERRLAKANEEGLGHPDYAVPINDVLLDPHETGTLAAEVTPGTYVLLCGKVYHGSTDVRPFRPLGPMKVT